MESGTQTSQGSKPLQVPDPCEWLEIPTRGRAPAAARAGSCAVPCRAVPRRAVPCPAVPCSAGGAGWDSAATVPRSVCCPWQEAICLRGKETRRFWRRQSHAASHCFSQLLIQERLCLLPAFLSALLPSSLKDRTQTTPPGNALDRIR